MTDNAAGVDTARFDYRARGTATVFAVIIALVFVGGAGYAFLSGWGIKILGVRVEPDLARWIYLILVVIGLFLGFMALRTALAGRREIVVSPQGISAPAGESSRRIVTIDPRTIRNLKVEDYNGVSSLVIRHDGGTLRIRGAHFDSPAAFQQCVQLIHAIAPRG